jgi:hypothetical protein
MWEVIGISLTCTLEESTEHGVGTREYVRSQKDLDHQIIEIVDH